MPRSSRAAPALLLLLLAAALSLPAATRAADPPQGPNVLFLVWDDLNCDIGSYGHPQVQTPHIDRLAARGVRFERAYCQWPVCGPSRASFLSGLYPDQTLIRRNALYLREHVPNVITLPQLFKHSGYFATRIGKLYHYGVPSNIGTGGHDDPHSWNQTINPRGRDVDDEPHIFSLRPGRFGATLSWLAAEGEDEEQTDAIAAAEAVERLRRHADDGSPFFLAVGFYRPHTPFVAPKAYFDLYPPESIMVPKVPEGYDATLPAPALHSIRRKTEQVDLADELAREAIRAYYAAITFADAQLGKVLDALEETGLEENTVVLFTSDHGYHMGEHGHYQKSTLFEAALRVPLIIAGPGVEAEGEAAPHPVEMTDFYPTLVELCGLEPPQHLSGVSLVPALRNPAAAPRSDALSRWESGYSLRTLRHRYTEWGEDGADGRELYDHESDPEELVNLAGRPELAELEAALSARLRQRIAQANAEPPGVRQIRFENDRRERQ